METCSGNGQTSGFGSVWIASCYQSAQEAVAIAPQRLLHNHTIAVEFQDYVKTSNNRGLTRLSTPAMGIEYSVVYSNNSGIRRWRMTSHCCAPLLCKGGNTSKIKTLEVQSSITIKRWSVVSVSIPVNAGGSLTLSVPKHVPQHPGTIERTVLWHGCCCSSTIKDSLCGRDMSLKHFKASNASINCRLRKNAARLTDNLCLV